MIDLNPGYLSLLLLCITAALLFTGWKNTLLQGASMRLLLLFYIGIASLGPIVVPLAGFRLRLGFVMIALVGIGALAARRPWSDRSYVLAASLLVASFYSLLSQLYASDPVLILYSAFLDPAALLVIVTLLLFRKPMDQIAALSLGMAAGEAVLSVVSLQKAYILGSVIWSDQWWLTVCAVRMLTVLIDSIKQIISRLGDLLHTRMEDWRRRRLRS